MIAAPIPRTAWNDLWLDVIDLEALPDDRFAFPLLLKTTLAGHTSYGAFVELTRQDQAREQSHTHRDRS